MKKIFLLLLLLAAAPRARADVAPELEGTNMTGGAEIFAMVMSSATTLINLGMIIGEQPNATTGGIGVVVGAGTAALSALNTAEHPTGTLAIGAVTTVVGLLALRYRHVLNQQARYSRLEPTWRHGAPGLALVVDF